MQIDFSRSQEGLKFKEVEGQRLIYDPVRRQYMVLQPEELVRQSWIQLLHHECEISLASLAIEKEFKIDGRQYRYDMLYFQKGKPHTLFEFKGFNAALNQDVGLQIASYNLALQVPHLVISNGNETYIYHVDFNTERVTPKSDLPFKIKL